jgi:hypothetical protein
MIATNTRNELGITVAKDLRTVMHGNVAIAGEASYEAARQVVNGAVDRRPMLFAFCESARDVQEAVRAARAWSSAVRARRGARLGRKGAEPPGAGSGSLSDAASRGSFGHQGSAEASHDR